MGLFSKKEKIPELPSMARLPDLPKRDIQELPSVPNNEAGEEMNNLLIKSAVGDSSGEKEDEENNKENNYLEELPKDFNFEGEENIAESIESSDKISVPFEDGQKEKSNQNFQPFQPTQSFSQFSIKPKSALPPIPETPKTFQPIEIKTEAKSEPIFVRIDKFQSAQKDFFEIKKKISEVEDVLKKVKEVKEREHQEISEWHSDLEKIKTRLMDIESNIFNQI